MFIQESKKTVTVRKEITPPEWMQLAIDGDEDEAIRVLRSFCSLSGAQARSVVRSVTDNMITHIEEHSQ